MEYNLILHLILILFLYELAIICKKKYKKNELNFVFSSIFAFVTVSLGLSMAWGIGIGVVGAAIVYGGMAISMCQKSSNKGLSSSSTYGGQQTTQTDQNLPIPLLYGTVKVAGNRIWQNDPSATTIKRIVAVAEGEIDGISNIKLNNIAIGDIAGAGCSVYIGTETQQVDGIIGYNSHEERAKQVGSLRNVAYLAISCPSSQKISNNYNLTCIVKGKKVRVYTSTTKYTVKYSENPAWILLDVLTCYNGLGLGLNSNGQRDDANISKIFDLDTFLEAAQFCDEQVPYSTKDNNGNIITKFQPRFTFNMIFDSRMSVRDVIDEIYRACRGGLFYHNGKLQFKIDKAEEVSKVFTENDIVAGSETFKTLPDEQKYDILKVVYISPQHEWQKVEAYAELTNPNHEIPVEYSVNLYSCTNFQQASRLAWYYLNQKRLCPYYGSFKTDYRAYDVEIGDVIKIDSMLMGLKAYKVKVTQVTDDGNGTFTVDWQTYDERLYSDELGSKEPTVIISSLEDKYGYPADVIGFNVVQNQNLFSFVWNYTNVDSDTYEIRMGQSWETSEVIARNLTSNEFSYPIRATGLYKFWIVAFNGYNVSKNPTLDVIQINDIPNSNEIVHYDLLSTLDGTFENTKSYRNTIKLLPLPIKWQKSNDSKWGDSAVTELLSTAGLWGGKSLEVGTYTSQVYDLGEILKSVVSSEIETIGKDTNNNVIIEIQTSVDGENWNEWKLLAAGEYTFRYSRYRLTIYAPNQINCVVTKLLIHVDVPDKIINIDTEVIDANEGVLVSYEMNIPPSIVATVQDSIAKYAVVPIEEKTKRQAKIFIYDNNGNKSVGKISCVIRGY